MGFSPETAHVSEMSHTREAIQTEIARGIERAIEGRTAWTDVLLTVFPDAEPVNDVVMDDRTYSADVARGAILSNINQLTELEEQLVALEQELASAA